MINGINIPYYGQRLYTQGDLDDAVNKAADDGLQEGAQVSDEAYREGFLNGYAAAVEDHERGEFIDPSTHLQRSV